MLSQMSQNAIGSAVLKAEVRAEVTLASIVAGSARPENSAHYPVASTVVDEVVVYEAQSVLNTDRGAVLAELEQVLEFGPGVFVIRGAVPSEIVQPVTTAFEQLIAEQRARGSVSGDHFAAAGANDRLWNALEKLAIVAPEAFVDYYANDIVHLASLAWLGPGYQITSQVNVVNPGGAAQNPHCDYHLGFMSPEQASAFSAGVHAMSRRLTLQGAIAHCDMPVASGPTKLLPHSQKYAAGYLESGSSEIAAYFEENFVQIPLRVGDAMFFNPALIHAAGSNVTSDVRRMANLLQVSSAFGRAMESVDRARMCCAVYPVLQHRERGGWTQRQIENVIAATAEGYAFPTNLDRDPPIGGLAPPSQADVLRRAIDNRVSTLDFRSLLDDHGRRRMTT
jgi:ectoine hydroxylase-related dioxygenase (phytanoyl-CoA dioxygenase family)